MEMDWFLYDNGLRHKRVKPIARKKLDTTLLHVRTHDLTKGINTMKNIIVCGSYS